MKRREFIKNAGLAATASAGIVAGCSNKETAAPEPVKGSSKSFKWKMITTWPPKFPVFQTGMDELADRVRIMSGGRLDIQVFAGGELAPPLGVLDAVSQGSVEMGHSAAYYWAGKAPELQFFSTAPFGFTAQQINSWLYYGGGIELLHEMYKPFNVISFPAGNTGVQMGGWFNKKIESMDDFKGLKMRIPGLGGKVISKAGGNVVLLPAGDLYTALERGTIDALEWVGPYHDLKLGFYRAAKYYYYPGWHEPGTAFELLINREAWASLPDDLKVIVQSAAAEANIRFLAELDAKNGAALDELVTKYNVTLLKYPDDVMKQLRKLSDETLQEEAGKSAKVKKVYDAFRQFSGRIEPWSRLSEAALIKAKRV